MLLALPHADADTLFEEFSRSLSQVIRQADPYVPKKYNKHDTDGRMFEMHRIIYCVLPMWEISENQQPLLYRTVDQYFPHPKIEDITPAGLQILHPPFPSRTFSLRTNLKEYPGVERLLHAKFPDVNFTRDQRDLLLLPVLAINFLEERWKFERPSRQSQWHAAVMLNAFHRLSEVLCANGDIVEKIRVITAIVTTKKVHLNYHWMAAQGGKVIYYTRRLPTAANLVDARRQARNALQLIVEKNGNWLSEALWKTEVRLKSGSRDS